ncbi:uncharacterized protein UV8b_08197 [Ustilaginoidea virens]|uniref:Uncharacterized protein n=1 Tax=Ustilaginoidea virens TaxID=1159556 RepID=A0A8E5MLA5_USTVR|nr:uncharacterized protein UV8b_08197 [Ustilaginoidea virens]QUC23956.1 hypothetical protein UV8b_08197 [Ustilaginoidea virens]
MGIEEMKDGQCDRRQPPKGDYGFMAWRKGWGQSEMRWPCWDQIKSGLGLVLVWSWSGGSHEAGAGAGTGTGAGAGAGAGAGHTARANTAARATSTTAPSSSTTQQQHHPAAAPSSSSPIQQHHSNHPASPTQHRPPSTAHPAPPPSPPPPPPRHSLPSRLPTLRLQPASASQQQDPAGGDFGCVNCDSKEAARPRCPCCD